MITLDEIRQALARGYCRDGNTHKVLDPDLIEAMAAEVMIAIQAALVAKYDPSKEPKQ